MNEVRILYNPQDTKQKLGGDIDPWSSHRHGPK